LICFQVEALLLAQDTAALEAAMHLGAEISAAANSGKDLQLSSNFTNS
jgi:hypothetical protein